MFIPPRMRNSVRTASPSVAALVAAFVLALPGAAHAAWPTDPNVNLPLCNAVAQQWYPVSLSDDAGGAFVAWVDYRSDASGDIYIQRVSADGVALWTADGVPVCTATDLQFNPRLASDGAGGVVVAWEDARLGAANQDLYAQRFDASGTPLWTLNGRVFCIATGVQEFLELVPGSGGTVVAVWADRRSATTLSDIYAQSLLSNGAGAWTANGVVVCNANAVQSDFDAVSDGLGGVYAAWSDRRTSTSAPDIYAQHLNSAGTPLWTANGVLVSNAAGAQDQPAVSTYSANLVIAWRDGRTSGDLNLYAQALNVSGTPQWTANGRAVCVATGTQDMPLLRATEAGEIYIAWRDRRAGTSQSDAYVQKLNTSGVAQWTADGVSAHADLSGPQIPERLELYSGGGIWLTWSTGSIVVQRMGITGLRLMGPDGVNISRGPGARYFPTLVSQAGYAIVAWSDDRHAEVADIYAQRVEYDGFLGDPAARILSVLDVPYDQGGHVKLRWAAAQRDLESDPAIAIYVIEGQLPSGSWEEVQVTPAIGLPEYAAILTTSEDSSAVSPARRAYRVVSGSTAAAGLSPRYSAPDSGYSVDNLTPAPPAALTGALEGGRVRLAWTANREADLAGYAIHRAPEPGFAPSAVTQVAFVRDPSFEEAATAEGAYAVVALDRHGNASAAVRVTLATGVAPGVPLVLAAAPNPAAGGVGTALRFGLPRTGRATLSLLDVSGRRVREIASASFAAGPHALRWDGRDERGGAVRPGVYFARLEFEDDSRIARLVVTW